MQYKFLLSSRKLRVQTHHNHNTHIDTHSVLTTFVQEKERVGPYQIPL